MDTLTLAKFILPMEIVDNFDIVDIKIKGQDLNIKLDEKLVHHPEHRDKQLESMVFFTFKKNTRFSHQG